MRLSLTMSSYIGRNFFFNVLTIFIVFMLLILLFDSIELTRRASSVSTITLPMVLELSILKLPHMGQKIFPFAVLFGGMATFWRLARHHELVITRAAGISAWQFLLPALLIAFLIGVFIITLYNPLASATLMRYERLESSLFKGKTSLLALTESGLWLRQVNKDNQSVIHSRNVFQQKENVELKNVIVFVFEGKDKFRERIEARLARLKEGYWLMSDVWLLSPEHPPRFTKEYRLETDLTLGKIQDSFAPPETLSFWDLPEFIETLEKAGFSALRHRLHLHSLWAAPLLMCAMVLIAATFTLRQSRRGGTTYIIAGGVLTGFVLYFFSDVVFALGLSDSLPVTLAAWTPAGVATLLGLAMLLHLEDG
ncbi:MAG: LPS export ABC transporter permease LptG [Rhodospirillales bacterium]|nr:LPS export ABC transporter permease LptG [Rhodospirillales bacterium]